MKQPSTPAHLRLLMLLVTLLFTITTFAQSGRHQPIPGTNISMVPPAGFVPASKFFGFQDVTNGGFIMVEELPAALQIVTGGFSEEAMASKGMKLIKRRNVDFNSQKAVYLTISQLLNDQSFRKHILIFGDSAKTVMITGGYPEESIELAGDIERAIFSTRYHAEQKKNEEQAAPFKIDVGNTGLKFATGSSGTLTYNMDGKLPSKTPYLIVTASTAPVKFKDRRQFSIQLVKTMPGFASYGIYQIEEVGIDGMTGHGIEAYGTNKDLKEELLYLVTLYDERNYCYTITGVAAEDMKSNLQKFVTVSRTFKRK